MKILCKNKHWKLNEEYNIDKILYLLIDRPDYVDNFEFNWENKKNIDHRNYDLPAVIYNDGYVAWYQYDIFRRENNKPVSIFYSGRKTYHINGKFIKTEFIK